MSNDNPTSPPAPEPAPAVPAQPEPAPQPYAQPAYQQPAYQPPTQYAPRPARPPLTKRAKTGAAWAGIIGFNLSALGFFVFITPLLLLALGSFLIWIVEGARAQGTAEIGADLIRFLEDFNPGAFVVPILIISAVGLVIWIVALIISRSILRASGAVKPWGITWAALAIAIVAYWIITSIVSFFSGFISMAVSAATQSIADPATTGVLSGVISFVVLIVITSVIGWLSWWWMAHAMRPDEQQIATQE